MRSSDRPAASQPTANGRIVSTPSSPCASSPSWTGRAALRYNTGARKGEIKTTKVRYFRAPNERDLEALAEAERRLAENWDALGCRRG